MTNLLLIQIAPKVPAGLLRLFLKGIGCTEVMSSVQNGLETWIDFKFSGRRFEAHRDIDEWRFFAGKDCSAESASALAAKIRIGEISLQAWVAVCKGLFI